MWISASRSDSRNSCGPSKSRIRTRTEPRPAATWASEPARGGQAVLGGEARRLLVEGADRDARVEDLDRVDLVEDREQVLVAGHGVHAVERVRHVDEAALAADLGDGLREAHAARDALVSGTGR